MGSLFCSALTEFMVLIPQNDEDELNDPEGLHPLAV